MTTNAGRIITGAIVVLAVVFVVLLNRFNDICSDAVRGYERDVSTAISIFREAFSLVKADVRARDSYQVPPIDGLTPQAYKDLRGFDAQCKLLERCMCLRFGPPSEICQKEYADFQKKQELASALVEEVQRTKRSVAQQAQELVDARQKVKSFENTSSSTGGRLPILQATVRQLEGDLLQTLAAISSQIDGVTSSKTKKTDQ